MFNAASSEDLGEEQAVLNLVGTTQALHQHSMATPSTFNTTISENLGEEQAVLNLVVTTRALHQHSTATPSIFNAASSWERAPCIESCCFNTSTAPAEHNHTLNFLSI